MHTNMNYDMYIRSCVKTPGINIIYTDVYDILNVQGPS